MSNHINHTQQILTKAQQLGLQVECPPSGRVDAEIAIISDCPSYKEYDLKMPLVGYGGQKVWDILNKNDTTTKLKRANIYCTHAIKKQMSKDDKKSVHKTELDHWRGFLEWELSQLPNLKYILILGRYGLDCLFNDDKIMNWRGSVLDLELGGRHIQCTISVNPLNLYMQPELELLLELDIRKFISTVDGSFVKYNITHHINPTFKQAKEFIQELKHTDKPIAFDIECMHGETVCYGFANSIFEGMCINLINPDGNHYTQDEEEWIRILINDLFMDRSKQFVMQNGSFDMIWCGYKDRLAIPNCWFDTLLAHHTLFPLLPHSLGFLTTQYTTHPYYKDDGKDWKLTNDLDQFWRYNVTDACVTLAVQRGLHKELIAERMDKFFFNHVMKLQPHLVNMSVTGIKVDSALKAKLSHQFGYEVERLEQEWLKQVRDLLQQPDYTCNPKSPKQLQNLLFNKLGLKGYGDSTNAENRNKMIEHPLTTDDQRSMLETLNKYAEADKFYSTYVESVIDEDGRMRCEYKQFGVAKAPGRLSSSGTMWKSGMNMQNQPQQAYPMFIADDGYMLTYFDLKQAEAKVVAWLWNVKGLKDSFIAAETDPTIDLHRRNASNMFRVPYDQVPTYDRDAEGKPTIRFYGKKCVHGLNYRMGIITLATQLGLKDLNLARELYYKYHNAFPEIQQAWEETIKEVKATGELYSPLGRRMKFLGAIRDDMLDSVVAFRPQSTIGDHVASIIYKVERDKDFPTNEAKAWLNIHDALIFMHKPQHKEVITGLMKKYAEEPIKLRGELVSIGTDFKYSQPDEKGIHRWSTLKG